MVDGILKLKNSVSVDFETNPTLSISITSTDSMNNTFSKEFIFKVVDQNDNPLDIILSSQKIQGAFDGAIVGTLSTMDEDLNDAFTFTLSGTDAEKFEIIDGQLKLKTGISADYEKQNTYSVTITSEDSGGGTVSSTFSLIVIADIDISRYGFEENEAGVVVGDLSVTDDSFDSNTTFSLSGEDAEFFEIVNNQLKLKENVTANFENKNTYEITLTVIDGSGQEASVNFELTVLDINESPSELVLFQDEPDPTSPAPPSGDGDTISVVVTVQNGQMYFDGKLQSEFALIHGNTYIFEQSVGPNGHVLGISATNGGTSVNGLTYSYVTPTSSAPINILASTYTTYLTNPAYVSYFGSYTFFVTYKVPDDGPDTLYFFSTSSSVAGGTFSVSSGYVPPPDPPVSVDPDAISINENDPGAEIGTLVTTDADTDDVHVYTLSGADADLFEVVDGKLKFKDGISANYEDKSFLSIIITATDKGGLSVSQSINFSVANLNDAPSKINLSSFNINEAIFGGVVGNITSIDDDAEDSHTYQITGEDSEFFEIKNGQLKLKSDVIADYETKQYYSITITSSDSAGANLTQDFTITVNNINEPVSSISLEGGTFVYVPESVDGQVIGELIDNDPDLEDSHTYLITGQDAKYFEVVNGVLKLKAGISLDYETLSRSAIDSDGEIFKYLDVTVTIIDSGGFAVKNDFTVYVSDVNDAPTSITLWGSNLGTGANYNAVIGKLEVADVDDQDFTFAIDNIESNNGKTYSPADFEIVNGILRVKNEDASGNWIEVRGEFGDLITFSISATDSAGNVFSQQFDVSFAWLIISNMTYTKDPANMSFTIEIEENSENPFVGDIVGINGSVFDEWTYALEGPDAQFFEIRGDANNSGPNPEIYFIGTPDHETKSSYDVVVVAVRTEDGLTLKDYWTIEVVDRNDQPSLFYSHVDHLTYHGEAGLETTRIVGIREEVQNPYIMTLDIRDQDLSDSVTIKITYKPLTGYSTDADGNVTYSYGSDVDITDLFTFDANSGSLSFKGSIDFETLGEDLTGILSGHRWYDPIKITITDNSGSKDSFTVLMAAVDSSTDGTFSIGSNSQYYNFSGGSYYNFSHEYTTALTGPKDIDTDEYPELIKYSLGDINNDGILDYAALYTNNDSPYYSPGQYFSVQISLGGSSTFPYYQPEIDTWAGPNTWNSVLGNGLGSVTVLLPSDLPGALGDPLRGLSSWDIKQFGLTDFNGDGFDDLILQIGDLIIVGYGKNFDNKAPQGTNIWDLRDLSSNSSVGYFDFADGMILKEVGDFNNDGFDELVFQDNVGDLYIYNVQGTDIWLEENLIQQYSEFGDYIAIGDFDGDGFDDIAVTADDYDKNYALDSDEGAVLIFLGGQSGLSSSPSVTIIGPRVDAEIGWSGLNNLGDLNGDGYHDLGFGDGDFSIIFWGKSFFSATYDLALENPPTNITVFDNEDVGYEVINDVTGVGDLDGDGYDDVTFKHSYYDSSVGRFVNEIVVLYGQQTWAGLYDEDTGMGGLDFLTINIPTDNFYATAILPLGDMDGDGKNEFGITVTTSEAYSTNDGILIWNGSEPTNSNDFSVALKQTYFTITENESGAIIGNLEAQNGLNLSTYSLYIESIYADGEIVDNNFFEISSTGQIKLKDGVSINASTYASFELEVIIVDQDNDQISRHFVKVNVNDVNEAPALTLSSRFVDDSAQAGSVIGTITANDPENGIVTLSLSGDDAGQFIIDSETNELKFADDASIDLSSQNSFSVTITATDSSGLTAIENITVEINQAPTAIVYEAGVVQESARGIALGQIKVTDPNGTDAFTYSIAGDYAFMFSVSDEGVLQLAENYYLDYEELGESMVLSITATDASGLSIAQDITIEVADIEFATPSVSELKQNYVIKPTDTIIDGILLGFTLDPDWNPNTPLTVTYSFLAADTEHLSERVQEDVGDFGLDPSSHGFKESTIEALNYLGGILGITFVEVIETDTAVGDIRFILFNGAENETGYAGAAYPGDYGLDQVYDSSIIMDILIDASNNLDADGNPDFSKGSYGYNTILHEIGHVLGLGHGHEGESTQYWNYGPEGDVLQETLYFESLDELGYKSYGWQGWTVMDYREYEGHSHANLSSEHPAATIIKITETGENFYATTFMPLDISAALYLYGWWDDEGIYILNPVNSGDDTYVLEGPFFETIHDTGGTDTLDWSATSDNTQVNLNPFSLSYFGENKLTIEDGSGQVDSVGWLLGISEFTYIENVKAGSGNDTITLNNVANMVQAGDGNDLIYGIDSGDNVYGEDGDDYFSVSSFDFSLVDGGAGTNYFTSPQQYLDNGLLSVDFRDIPAGKISNITFLDYRSTNDEGQILISEQTFKSFGKDVIAILSNQSYSARQAIGLDGDFAYSGSTDYWDIYKLTSAGELYLVYVLKGESVYNISDSEISFSLTNNKIPEIAGLLVGHLNSFEGGWIGPDQSASASPGANIPDLIFSISGDDAEHFSIVGNTLYFISSSDYETKTSYNISIQGVSLSGKSITQNFTIEIQDVDESSYTSTSDNIGGTGGDDYLYGGQGNDTISGGAGNDHLTGGPGNDTINGGEGDDLIYGWQDSDTLAGGSGSDVIFGYGGDDVIHGNDGNDWLSGDAGNDTIIGGIGLDYIEGDSGNDLIYGDQENGESSSDNRDQINAGNGDDEVYGRGGNDDIYGGWGSDYLNGGSGMDAIYGGYDNDELVGGSGNDNLWGDDGDDIIYGDSSTGDSSQDGDDRLFGGFGDDELYGRGGDDYLVGQNGLDTLTGGEGADVFVLTSYSSSDSKDTIKDYVDGTDKIGLINIDFDSLTITQDVNAVDTNISDSDGNIIAVLEGVSASDIDAEDFVSLDFDLSEILEVTPSMVNLELVSLGVGIKMTEDINGEQFHSDAGSANNSTSDSPGSASSNHSFNSNALISGDLIDSLIDHTEDPSIGLNDFI